MVDSGPFLTIGTFPSEHGVKDVTHDDPKQAMRYETAARLSAFWFINNQCTEAKPWSRDPRLAPTTAGTSTSTTWPTAGAGRWVSGARPTGSWRAWPAPRRCRARPIETMGVANHCVLSAVRAANYLMSLQVLDSRKPFAFGGFREHAPTTIFSYPAMPPPGRSACWRCTG